jgi:hypothetical protein
VLPTASIRKPYKILYSGDTMSRYLLIVGCSQKKNPSPYPLKAIDRYDGVNFRVIKKFKRERKLPGNLDIVIVSAKYGFLRPDDYIDDYNLRMTKQKARSLHSQILSHLRDLFSNNDYQEIFVNLGKDYLPAIKGIEDSVSCPIVHAEGRIGEKMGAMKRWITRIALFSEDQKNLTDCNL